MSDQPVQKKAPLSPEEFQLRDSETYIAIGLFVVFMAVPVLIGTIFAVRTHAMIVNAIAGLVLLAMGVIITWVGIRGRARAKAAKNT